MVKSLYTLRLSSGYNDLLNSENLKVDIGSDNFKVAITQLCNELHV